ncbi:MAG: type II toxin-antitoxin system MqsA family antitoxin [bacterium]
MKCVICKNGDTAPGETTVTFSRDNNTVVFHEVPAEICQNCGEDYIDEKTTKELLEKANEIMESGAEIDIRKYRAA